MSWFPFFISWPSLIPFRNQGFLCMALLFIFHAFSFLCVCGQWPTMFVLVQTRSHFFEKNHYFFHKYSIK